MSIVANFPEFDYHSHSALSSTGARRLLDSPAKFAYALTQAQEPKAVFDLGHAVHAKVLGVGAETVLIPEALLASNGAASTAAAKEFIAKARANGETPVKEDVYSQVQAMSEAVLAHPMARALFEQDGIPEASVFATDPDTEVEIRARFDYLATGTGTRVAVDLKTARNASPHGFSRAAAEHGYHVQRGHYLDAYEYSEASDLDGFVFVVVESEAPHLVGVHRLNSEFEEIGVKDARRAREIYRQCVATNTWPGYGDEIHSLIAPFWLIADYQENNLNV